jgi:TonB family protein
MIAFAAGTSCALPTAAAAQTSTPRSTPTPAPCARPNVAAMTVHPVEPATPPMAKQQGITGTVQVVVSLDENSQVVGARIQSSPSAILNAAALAAVRASTFQTEIRDCRPLARDYIYTVDFQNTVTFSTTASGERTVSVVGEGTVTRAADLAYVQANIDTRADDVTVSAAQNDAAFAALNAKLAPLGLTARTVRDPIRVGSEDRYTTRRSVEIAVDDISKVDRTVTAVSAVASVGVTGIRFTLYDTAPAYRQALDLAVKDAETTARGALTAPQRLGAVRSVVVQPNNGARSPVAVVPYRPIPIVGGFTQPPVRVPQLEVRASATVTYAITP